MRQGGFVVDHEHNHCGQCWWEMRHAGPPAGESRPEVTSDANDVRLRPEWNHGGMTIDRYVGATDPDQKQ
jgi:hypothetical protein